MTNIHAADVYCHCGAELMLFSRPGCGYDSRGFGRLLLFWALAQMYLSVIYLLYFNVFDVLIWWYDVWWFYFAGFDICVTKCILCILFHAIYGILIYFRLVPFTCRAYTAKFFLKFWILILLHCCGRLIILNLWMSFHLSCFYVCKMNNWCFFLCPMYSLSNERLRIFVNASLT